MENKYFRFLLGIFLQLFKTGTKIVHRRKKIHLFVLMDLKIKKITANVFRIALTWSFRDVYNILIYEKPIKACIFISRNFLKVFENREEHRKNVIFEFKRIYKLKKIIIIILRPDRHPEINTN